MAKKQTVHTVLRQTKDTIIVNYCAPLVNVSYFEPEVISEVTAPDFPFVLKQSLMGLSIMPLMEMYSLQQIVAL